VIDHLANVLALRAQAIGMSAVASTGSTTLTATTTAYTRAAGSFITDGFLVGMEVVPAGFATNTPRIVATVSALSMTVVGSLTAEASGAGRSLTVGFPPLRAWENSEFGPTANRWYVEEDYLPGPGAIQTLGAMAQLQYEPMYVLRLYGIANTGIGALYKVSGAILNRFAPGYSMAVGSDSLRVRTNPAPYRGQVMSATNGHARTTITIPLRLRTANSI
jgi:hypothetical protein